MCAVVREARARNRDPHPDPNWREIGARNFQPRRSCTSCDAERRLPIDFIPTPRCPCLWPTVILSPDQSAPHSKHLCECDVRRRSCAGNVHREVDHDIIDRILLKVNEIKQFSTRSAVPWQTAERYPRASDTDTSWPRPLTLTLTLTLIGHRHCLAKASHRARLAQTLSLRFLSLCSLTLRIG